MIRWATPNGPRGETLHVKSWRSLTGSRLPQRPGALVENAARNSALTDSGRGWTLRQRLLLIITVALLPIAALSVLQGVDRARSDIADVQKFLIQSARATGDEEKGMLESGEQILRAVGSLTDVR